MRYIGKLWMDDTCPMSIIANELRLKDVAIFDTQDMVGTMQWRGKEILVLLHLSWGTMDSVQKLKVWAHHIEEIEDDELWKLIITMLKDKIRSGE